jgi:hypothetical protein
VTHLEQFFGFCAAAAVIEILPIFEWQHFVVSWSKAT